MQAAPLCRPEEVTMFTRRIVASVCALALAVPAAAAAVPAHDPPAAFGGPTVAGDTGSRNDQAPGDAYSQLTRAKALNDTKGDLRVGQSYAVEVSSLTPKQLAAAYGTALPTRIPQPAHAPAVSTDDGTNGWRIAAVAEAGLLAAIALGSAALVARARPRRGTAA
jgi:hypothetical protein